MIGGVLGHDYLRHRLAPAVLFSIGCGGLPAVFTVHWQVYLLQTSSITISCAGMYLQNVRWSLRRTRAGPDRRPYTFLGLGQIVHDAFALQMRGQWTAATRLCSGAAVGRCGRIFVIGAAVPLSFDRSSIFTP